MTYYNYHYWILKYIPINNVSYNTKHFFIQNQVWSLLTTGKFESARVKQEHNQFFIPHKHPYHKDSDDKIYNMCFNSKIKR